MNYLQERRPINIGEMINISLACMHNFTRSSEQEDAICILGVEFLRE